MFKTMKKKIDQKTGLITINKINLSYNFIQNVRFRWEMANPHIKSPTFDWFSPRYCAPKTKTKTKFLAFNFFKLRFQNTNIRFESKSQQNWLHQLFTYRFVAVMMSMWMLVNGFYIGWIIGCSGNEQNKTKKYDYTKISEIVNKRQKWLHKRGDVNERRMGFIFSVIKLNISAMKLTHLHHRSSSHLLPNPLYCYPHYVYFVAF